MIYDDRLLKDNYNENKAFHFLLFVHPYGSHDNWLRPGKGRKRHYTEAEKRVAEQAEQQAKWERYVAYVGSVRRVDHSVDAYLRSAWICHCKEEYAPGCRNTLHKKYPAVETVSK